jgi:membrane protein implicated in regulation of membrane protease activity
MVLAGIILWVAPDLTDTAPVLLTLCIMPLVWQSCINPVVTLTTIVSYRRAVRKLLHQVGSSNNGDGVVVPSEQQNGGGHPTILPKNKTVKVHNQVGHTKS